jgi:hypothetical protein
VIVLDSGYDVVRLTWLLADLPVHLLGRIRADRVMYGRPGPRRGERPGRQPRHGQQFRFADPSTHHPAERETTSTHDRFGAVAAHAWGRLHPTPARRGAWAEHAGQLPIVEGTIIHVAVDHLPGDRAPKPLWLWFGHPDAATVELTLLWRTYLRRFDIEHTFRFFKQTLGFTRARPRTPEQADRWAWLILVAYNQLRLAASKAAVGGRRTRRRPLSARERFQKRGFTGAVRRSRRAQDGHHVDLDEFAVKRRADGRPHRIWMGQCLFVDGVVGLVVAVQVGEVRRHLDDVGEIEATCGE